MANSARRAGRRKQGAAIVLLGLCSLAAMPVVGQDTVAPTLLVLSPARGAVIGGVETVKVQFWDATGPAGSSPLQWRLDADPFSASGVVINGNYVCGPNCNVYEFTLDTTGLVNGSHTLSLRGEDSLGNVDATLSWPIVVNNSGGRPAGSGQLLRRTHGAQICLDCHALASHSSQWTSTNYGNWAIDCFTCHDPHRTPNVFLVREQLETPISGTKTIRFHFDDRTGETNPGSAPGDFSFLGDRSGVDNAPYDDGICESCHTQTKYHRNDTSGPNNHAHNANVRCLKCHAHDRGFKGSGVCLDCHGNAGDSGTAGPNGRRPVLGDFAQMSHHVGDGGVMGGSLTNFDCVVCHAEGRVDTSGAQPEVATVSFYHGGDGGTTSIDLKDADTWDDADPTGGTVVVYSFDKEAVTASAGGAAGWNSADPVWRYETSGYDEVASSLDAGKGLDRFCVSCHDQDGASASRNAVDTECGGTPEPLNPFCDGTITNANDQQDRTRVVDIRSKVSNTGTDANADGIPDTPPQQGQYSRHAIRGQSTSRYTIYQNLPSTCTDSGVDPCDSMWEGPPGTGSLLVDLASSDPRGPLWNDTSVMGCADCHTVDGAHGSGGNAHGSPSEYLLKDEDDADGVSEGNLAARSYVCYRCHVSSHYQPPRSGNHTGNSQDWVDTTTAVGLGGGGANGRVYLSNGSATDANIFGMACFNCHGGTDWGTIHGTSEVLGIEDAAGTGGFRNAYRFTNGSSMRYFDPEDGNGSNWSADKFSCFTLTNGDNWGSCTEHDGGRSNDRILQRPLSY